MYLASIVLLMLVLPVVSILIERVTLPGSSLAFLVGKWFVFWPVGIRLFVAGLRQTFNPEFTAETIFEVRDRGALKIVQEIGFGNLAMGLLGILTLFEADWIMPAAIAGGLYYGLAGIKHALNGRRNSSETVAMVSDLLIFALLAVWLIVTLFAPAASTTTA